MYPISHEEKMERMRQLRRVVEAAPDDRFDMAHVHCGTAMCAAGWAAVDGWFMDRGLGIMMVPVSLTREIPTFIVEGVVGGSPNAILALETFFQLTPEEATDMFAGEAVQGVRADISKAEVIENIDRVLSGARPVKYRFIQELLDLEDGEDDSEDASAHGY